MKKIPPFVSFLVFGIVSNSQGNIISNAKLSIKTSVSTITKFTDSNGLFLYDLAEAGYTEGETVTVNVTVPFNNEIQTQTYIVEDSFLEENITTELRTRVEKISELQTQNVLHSVGKTPITKDNPLSVTTDDTELFEERRAYNNSGQVEFIGESNPGGNNSKPVWRIHKRTYVSNRLTKIAWANFNAKFNKIWNNRTTYNYR